MSNNKRKREEYEAEPHQPLKRAKLEGTSSFENMPLPAEIVAQIFESMDRKDLVNCLFVCKYWHDCALDRLIGWMPFLVNQQFRLSHYSYPQWHNGVNIWSYATHQSHAYSTWESLYPGKPFSVRDNKLWDKEGKTLAFFASWSAPRQEICFYAVNENLWRRDFTRQGEENYFVDVLLNLKEFDRLVYNGEPIEAFPDILSRVQTEVQQFLITNGGPKELKTACIPYRVPRIEQPNEIAASIKLHNYQLDAISWMKSIENETDIPFKYCDLVPWRSARIDALFDLHNGRAVSPEKAGEYIGEMKSKGGILADEMGLGKTIEIIGLIASNPAPKDLAKLRADYDPELYNSRATLVTCPNHIAQQWIDEIAKYSEKKMKTILLSTANDLRGTSYQQVVDADVVVVTYQLLKNKNYFDAGIKGKKPGMGKDAPLKRRAAVLNTLKDGKAKGGLTNTFPILDHFHFHRIVLDEGHEALSDPFLGNMVQLLQKSYAWFVSGTPFPNIAVMPYLKRFLEIWEPDFLPESSVADLYECWVESDLIYNNLVWRNTKESVESEYSVPDTDEELVFVDFHPYETILYDQYESSKFKVQQLKLCCGLFYESTDLVFIRKNKISTLIHQVEWLNKRIEQTKAEQKSFLERSKQPLTKDALRQNGVYDINIAENEKQLATATEFLRRWQSVDPIFPDELEADEKESKKKIKKLSEEDEKKNKMINRYGSKLTRLSSWLKELFSDDPKHRAILFSKFTDYLRAVEELLNIAGVPCAFLEGTVTNKTKILQQFKEENSPIKVILLSLEKSASGTNLVEATHVVLLDPMSGTIEEARAYENQAIGRAYRQGQTQRVTVVRFVVNDTAEQELYLRNKSTSTASPIKTDRSQLVRTNSLATFIASSPKLKRSGSVSQMLNNNNNDNLF
jgi:SNF2 family DNA or RNA helicase